MKACFVFLYIFLLSITPLSAQKNSIDRLFVPIIQKTNNAPLFNLKIEEWSAFQFERDTREWRPIPFQIDQLSDKGRYDREQDGLADASDELVLMPTDLGDWAEASTWLKDDSTQSAPRIELQFVDPLSGKSGWIYLFKNVSTKPLISSHFEYIAGPADSPAADTIKTPSFTLGHNAQGWMDYLTLNDQKRDLIDRFKLRLVGDGFLTPPYEINEDFVEAQKGDEVVFCFPGAVRFFHIIKAAILIEKLNIPLLPKTSNFDYHFQYFPYSFQITAETDLDASLLALFGVQLIRQSLDLTENAVGMTVYSANNRDGLAVDGVPELPIDAITGGDDQNWVMVSGELGSILLIFEITPMKNSKRQLYYFDDLTGSKPVDGTQDTGDKRSFGDMGMMVKATGSALITPKLSVSYKGYFLNVPQLRTVDAEQIIAWDRNALTMTATEQYYTPAMISHQSLQPNSFQLFPAVPNPFRPNGQKNVRFEFSSRVQDVFELKVFNVLGQQVAEFDDMIVPAETRQTVLWDGRDQEGKRVIPGIYFCQLRSGMNLQTQRLIIQ
ncbi:MAG: T9SS C-terminal target domain-containing protein [Calditrichaeota bacterium]|nr:MAG: T9SS C-terminal target domain-containing protein [Calditrichota bacterium]